MDTSYLFTSHRLVLLIHFFGCLVRREDQGIGIAQQGHFSLRDKLIE